MPSELPDTEGGADVPAVAASVGPSVVRLDITTDTGSVSGSGVVLRDDGTVLTNAHLLVGATALTIVLSDGAGVRGRIVGSDRLTDIAVVTPDDPDADRVSWVPAVIGSADGLEVGQTAVSIGSPAAAAGGPAVTVGVVSGLDRRVTDAEVVLHGLIQTDRPIGVGSSGGALCDSAGVVIGVTTGLGAAEAPPAGFGYAIPAEVARAVAEDLIGDGAVTHPWLGIEGADLAPTEASLPGLADMGGVRVTEVTDRGPAAAAGIDAGDLVVRLEGDRVTSMSELVAALRRHRPGDVVRVVLRRDGDAVTVDVALAERP
jgi:S1-C subfamily serine protease